MSKDNSLYFGTCGDCGMEMDWDDFERHEQATCAEHKEENKETK